MSTCDVTVDVTVLATGDVTGDSIVDVTVDVAVDVTGDVVVDVTFCVKRWHSSSLAFGSLVVNGIGSMGLLDITNACRS